MNKGTETYIIIDDSQVACPMRQMKYALTVVSFYNTIGVKPSS